MWCTQLAGNAGPKNHHLRTIAQLYRAISSQLRHVLTIGKKLVKQQYLPTCPHDMMNVGPLTAKHRAKFSWLPLSDVVAVTKPNAKPVEIC